MIDLHNIGRDVLRQGVEALKKLADNLPDNFAQIVAKIVGLKGRLILSGMGKSGYIAQKIAASFSSTGTPALFIHPAEASHGDLGMVARGDIVMLLSNSGDTRELTDIIAYCKSVGIQIVGITMNPDSNLARYSNELLLIPKISEASRLGAPTTSCVMMLALGDALVVAAHDSRGLTKDIYRSLHPGGKIGANLKPISEIMHVGDKIPVVAPHTLMPEVLVIMTQKSLGCCAVVDEDRLIGIITDGDLRRHIDKNMLDLKAVDVMSPKPKVMSQETLIYEALQIMNSKGITNSLITYEDKLIGIIHIHDILRVGVA